MPEQDERRPVPNGSYALPSRRHSPQWIGSPLRRIGIVAAGSGRSLRRGSMKVMRPDLGRLAIAVAGVAASLLSGCSQAATPPHASDTAVHRLTLSSSDSGGTHCYRVIDNESPATAALEGCPSWEPESNSLEYVGSSSYSGGFTVLRLPISAEMIDASGPWERSGDFLVVEWGSSGSTVWLRIRNMGAVFDCHADQMISMIWSCTMETPDGTALPKSEP